MAIAGRDKGVQSKVKFFEIFYLWLLLFISRLCIGAKKVGKIFAVDVCMLKIKPALLHSQSGTTVAQTAKPLVLKDSEQRSL
uniref:hypothetical protein n=1 Tax=Dyadobacter sp. MSC1_007 TaxID=2909264 RepID=UPI00202FA828